MENLTQAVEALAAAAADFAGRTLNVGDYRIVVTPAGELQRIERR